jgi:hypothetical protein
MATLRLTRIDGTYLDLPVGSGSTLYLYTSAGVATTLSIGSYTTLRLTRKNGEYVDLQLTQDGYRSFPGHVVDLRGRNNERFTGYVTGTVTGSVWGTDTYTDDSPVGTAAVHAGKVALGQTALVTIEIRPGLSSYTASTRNGITTVSYGAWPGSYVFV